MDEPEYFVRIRGRVTGPFPLTQLKAFIRRGRVTRLHELSTDRTTWRRASEHADLFPPRPPQSQPQSPPAAVDLADDDDVTLELVEEPPPVDPQPRAAATEPTTTEQAASQAPAQWHYARGEDEAGPVSTDELRRLAAEGAVTPTTLVWKPGLPEWIPAGKVEQLQFAPPPWSQRLHLPTLERAAARTLIRVYGGVAFASSFAVLAGAIVLSQTADLQQLIPAASPGDARSQSYVLITAGVIGLVVSLGLWMYQKPAWFAAAALHGLGFAYAAYHIQPFWMIGTAIGLAVLILARHACGIGPAAAET